MMRLSEIKKILLEKTGVNFQLENGEKVPEHFHVTEVGVITRDFIDCGGKLRHEQVANFQLWNADDYDHRLKAQKLLNIISISERLLGMEDLQVEVEYQSATIGRYDLEYDGDNFLLIAKKTACLAEDACGLESNPKKLRVNLHLANNNCTPGGGCC